MESRKIDPQRLDVMLAQARARATEPATRAQIEEFEALLRSRARRRASSFASASLREEAVDFIMPRLDDAGIFQSSRFVGILESILGDTLPELDEDEDVRAVAAVLIQDEIDRHHALQARILAELAA